MADNTPQQNPGIETNTFNKGMMKDYNETFIGEGLYTHARNAVNNSHDGQVGVIGNEPANLACVTLPYTFIGAIHLLDDQWLVFSTDDTNSALGVFDESDCTYTPLKNRNNQEIDCSCLNLKRSNLITGVFRKRYDCERLVYWDDGLNPTRFLDVDVPACIQSCTTVNGCTTCVDTDVLDCEKVRVAPFVKHPCIKIKQGQVSGTLPNGSYQACIAYTINQVKVTDYIGLTDVQGLFTHENTSSSLEITVTSIDTTFDEFELVILSNINAQTVAKRIGYYNTSQGTIYVDRWNTEYVSINVGDVVFRSEPIERSDAMYSVNNYIIRSGIYSKFKFNYQPIANNIRTKWVAVQYPEDYYSRGNHNTGYMRDEQYAFFIRWVYNTGEFSESYHIPGRAALPGEMDNDATQDAFETTASPSLLRKVWQVQNTATVDSLAQYVLADGGSVIASGKMGYWESTEKYPSNRIDIWGDLCGQPIRHHKMPDETRSTLLSTFNSNGANIVLLGVQFENIQPPVDLNGNIIASVVGYEILRGSREGNKSIIAKGLLNNMRDYSIPGNSGVRGLYQNYPYNDLRQDYYLTGVEQTGENGSVTTDSDPMTSSVRNVFTFHSPDTTFSNPYLNAGELKIYQEMYGNSYGRFETPYKHPKFKVLRDIAFFTSTTLAGTILAAQVAAALLGNTPIVGLSASQDIPFTNNFTGPWSGSISAAGIIPGAIVPDPATLALYFASVADAALTVGILGALNLPTTIEQVLKIIVALVPKIQYAVQYNSHGFYNNSKINPAGNRRRKIEEAVYVGAGVQQFTTNYQVNNINRNKTIVLKTTSDVVNPTVSDDSRFIMGEVPAPGAKLNTTYQKNISSYYGSLKISIPSQYGQLDSIKQLPVSTCITPLSQSNSNILFGGDIYINRFTEKNTMFFFTDWLLGEPDEVEYDYTKYINIPYPRYWVNNRQKHSTFSLPNDYRSLDMNADGTFYIKQGYFYLFNSGVRDFFVESEVNVAYRDWEEDVPRRHYDPYRFTDLSAMFRSDVIKSGNYYKYDYALSISKLFGSHISWGNLLPRDYNPLTDATCYTYRPNRLVYSLPQQDQSKKDNWRVYLPNNYKDFTSNVTSIKQVNKTGALFMMKYMSPLQFMGVEELKLDGTGAKITIGDAGLFTGPQQLQAIVNADESYEYASNQGRYCSINTIHGIFWVSQNQGKVFQYAGQLSEISNNGMKWWFAKYLPSELLKKFPNYPLYDNPILGVGVQTIYDNTHEIIYITKKDWKPVDSNLQYNSSTNQFYVPTVPPVYTCPPGYTLVNNICTKTCCPEGYELVDGTCERTRTAAPVQTGTVYRLTPTPYAPYGESGTRVYDNPSLSSSFTLLNTSNPFWIRQASPAGFLTWTPAQQQAFDLNNGPVNRLAKWGLTYDGSGQPINNYNRTPTTDILPINEWTGFTQCITLSNSQVYHIGVAADNYYRISLDGTIVLESSTITDVAFRFLHIYPVTIPAGTHELKIEGLNTGRQACFAVEIYDLTNLPSGQTPVQYLNAQIDYSNLNTQNRIIFSTRTTNEFTSGNYECPAGYTSTTVGNCDVPVCTIIQTVDPIQCNIQAIEEITPCPFEDNRCFEPASWTISYDPKSKAWISFHDWIPTFLIPGRAHFMSVNVDSIWKHNVRCDSYANFYGKDYPFEVEFVSTTGQTVNSMRSIEYLLEVYKYHNDCRDKYHVLDQNFDQAIIYNSEQVSGVLRLNIKEKNNPLAMLSYPRINANPDYIDIQFSKEENKYRFNQFWDITNNRGEYSPINLPMFNTEANGYIYPINPAYVNYNKAPLERKKFRHNVNRVFLRKFQSDNHKFLFKISNQKSLQSPR
jgi:hypothetical protein